MVVINYCPNDRNGVHNFEPDRSSKGLLMRCRNCQLHIVTLPKSVYEDIKKSYKEKKK